MWAIDERFLFSRQIPFLSVHTTVQCGTVLGKGRLRLRSVGTVQLVCTFMFCSWRFPLSTRHLFQGLQKYSGWHVVTLNVTFRFMYVLLLVASSADCQKLTIRVLVDCHHVNGLRFPISLSPPWGVLVHCPIFSLFPSFFFLQSARSAHVTGYWKWGPLVKKSFAYIQSVHQCSYYYCVCMGIYKESIPSGLWTLYLLHVLRTVRTVHTYPS